MRYKATVAYDGSSYHGWQTQRKGNSIEEQIEKALYTMHSHPVEIVGSGRTDSKVHAKGQVFHFDSSLDIEEQRMLIALNSLLPNSIRIQKIERVADDFHARFDCVSKRYDFFLSNDTTNPFIRNYMAIESASLDVSLMKEAATIFVGKYDFTSFTSARINPKKDCIRTITRLDILEENSTIHFIYEGDGFLRYMVRMITQTLIMVGKEKLSYTEALDMLQSKDKHVCSYKADPQGLYLSEVFYKDGE